MSSGSPRNAGKGPGNTMRELDAEALQSALQRCEQEAIHQLGAIQPHGVLLALADDAALTILRASDNVRDFFPLAAASPVGSGLADLIHADQASTIRDMVDAGLDGRARSSLIYSVADENILELHAVLHRAGAELILEFEPIRDDFHTGLVVDLFESVRLGLADFDTADDMVAYCQVMADLVRSIIHFDRVMVYRFDADWDGEVIAESRSPVAGSYLGHRFPAGDIPPQARALYVKNPLRLVCDALAEPVPVRPALDARSGAPLDMSFAMLRAFSPVHVEYLRNMGVAASLSVSIILNGRLWGLIACHHDRPCFVPHPVREVLEFVGKWVSMKISALDASRRGAFGVRLGATITHVLRDIYGAEDIGASLALHGEDILALMDAAGAVIQVDGQRYRLGAVPSDDLIDALMPWLAGQPAADSLVTNHLVGMFALAADHSERASGLCASPVGGGRSNGCLWFRPEKLRTINWAGHPAKQWSTDIEGCLRISPRTSFATWQEIWRGHSERWQAEAVEGGAIFANALVEAIIHRRRRQQAGS